MVFAFIIHTLLPGQCNILYQQIFHGKDVDLPDNETRTLRKQLLENIASEVSHASTSNTICGAQ